MTQELIALAALAYHFAVTTPVGHMFVNFTFEEMFTW